MSNDLWAIIIPSLFGASGFITAIITWRQAARRDELDELSTIVRAVQAENERLRTRLKAMEDKNIALETELRLWKRHADRQRRVIVDLGGCPPEFPDES